MARLAHGDVARHLGWVTRTYRTYILGSAVVIAALSLVLLYLKDAGNIPDHWWLTTASLWAIYAVMLPASIAAHRFALWKSSKQLYVDRVTLTWHPDGPSGNLACDAIFENVTNGTNGPTSEFNYYREGFFTQPAIFKPTATVLLSTQPGISVTTPTPSGERRILTVGGRPYDLWLYTVPLQFVPPLAIGQKASIWMHYSVEGVERAAFEEAGSTAGTRVQFATRELVLRVIAPAGYRIDVHSCAITNEADTANKKKPRPATVRCGGVVCEWSVPYPKSQHRYVIKYGIRKLA